jgi:hypothetical protein
LVITRHNSSKHAPRIAIVVVAVLTATAAFGTTASADRHGYRGHGARFHGAHFVQRSVVVRGYPGPAYFIARPRPVIVARPRGIVAWRPGGTIIDRPLIGYPYAWRPWWTGAPCLYLDEAPYYFSADLGMYMGGFALDFSVGNVAPAGYVFYDPYCGDRFWTAAAYRHHLRFHHHPAALRVIAVEDDD